MEDWERAYEEDRRRLAMGQGIDVVPRRGSDEDDNPFAEQKSCPFPSAEHTSVMLTSDRSLSTPTGADGLTAAATSVPVAATERCSEVTDVADVYAPYSDAEPLSCADEVAAPREESEEIRNGGALHDARFGLSCLAPGWNMQLLFGAKFGRQLFFAEAVKTSFKGFFSSKDALVGCFVTPNCLYLGDVVTGALLVCLDLQGLFEVYDFCGAALGLRARDGAELHLQTHRHTARLRTVLCAIASHWGAAVREVSADAGRARAFRRQIRLPDRRESAWALVEDPRTGLRVVCAAGPALAPVAAKILHWFGGVEQPARDWSGARTRKRRWAWLTATCFFVARAEGPGRDGRGIRRCVAAEYVTELVLGPGAELGVVAGDGPPQPPLVVCFDAESDRRAVVDAMQQCYAFRKVPRGGAIRTSHAENVEERLGSGKGGDAQPHLFLMRPRKELYDFLRNPTRKG